LFFYYTAETRLVVALLQVSIAWSTWGSKAVACLVFSKPIGSSCLVWKEKCITLSGPCKLSLEYCLASTN